MKLDLMTGGLPLRRVQDLARDAAAAGYAGLVVTESSRGRFRLGLGTQVRAHVERRYGVEFDPPGPRMRDYLLAVRALNGPVGTSRSPR